VSGHNAAFESGETVGRAIGMLLPLIIGIVWSFRQRRKRGDGKFPAKPALIGLVITLLGLLGTAMAPSLAHVASGDTGTAAVREQQQ
jgi:hypothetical protein